MDAIRVVGTGRILQEISIRQSLQMILKKLITSDHWTNHMRVVEFHSVKSNLIFFFIKWKLVKKIYTRKKFHSVNLEYLNFKYQINISRSKLIRLQCLLSIRYIRYILKYFQACISFVSMLQNFFFRYLKKLLFRLAKFKKPIFLFEINKRINLYLAFLYVHTRSNTSVKKSFQKYRSNAW